MGGNAFSKPARRLSAEEYHPFSVAVTAALAEEGWEASVVPSYRTKRDFGDLDIVVSGDGDLPSVVRKRFAPEESSRNGECLSFLTGGFQVDLIQVPRPTHGMALAYFSWNDLGNLIGRVANRAGYHFGHRGLFAAVRDVSGNVFSKVPISAEPSKILPFLGYDFSKWKGGFDTPEDIFKYVAEGNCFDPEIFAYRNLNHTNRTRNRKRVMYGKFLEWLKENAPPSRFDFSREDQGWEVRAIGFFGDAWLAERDKVLTALRHRAEVRAKFNGELVASVTGLEGKPLGDFIRKMKSGYGDFDRWVVATDPDLIVKEIRRRVLSAGGRPPEPLSGAGIAPLPVPSRATARIR